MKRLIITLFMLMPLLCGCSYINANVEFLDNNNILYATELGSKENIPAEEVKIIKENYKNFLDDDFITDVMFSENRAAIQAIKISKNIKLNDIDLSSMGFKTLNKSGRFIDVKQNPFVTLYSVDLVYDLNSQSRRIIKEINNYERKEKEGLKPEYLQKYGDEDITLDNPDKTTEEDFRENLEENSIVKREISPEKTTEQIQNYDVADFKAKFSITLPAAASYNNADKAANNIYIWDIRTNEPTSIKLQYIVYNSWAITILLISVLLLLYLSARLILKHDSQKRIGTNN